MKKYILIITVLFLAGGLLRGETVGGDTRLNEKLFKAVSGGDTGLAALLLRKGADINAKDRFGWSPLHIAVYSGKVTVIHYLVSKKADLYSKTGKEKNIPVHERTRKVPKGAIPLHLAKRGFISMGSIQEVRECLYPFYKRKDFDAYIIEENLTDTFRRKKIRAYLKNTKSVNSFIDEYARSMGMLQQKVYSRTRLLRTFGHCQAYATDVKFEDVYPMLIATFISLLRHSQKIINIPYLRIDRSKKNPENRDLIMKINSFRAEDTVSNRTINALFFDTDFIPGIVSSCIDNPFLMLEKDSHGIKSLEIDNNKITIEGPVPSKTPEILKREIESGYKNKTAHISLRRKKDRFVLQFTYKSAVREFYTKSLNLSIDQRLLNAIRDRDPYLVKIYVQEGADINYQDEFGWTALHAAVYAGDIPLIQYLVKQNVRKYSRTTEDRVVRIPGREEIVKKGSRPLDLAQKGIIAQGLPEKVRASVYAYYKKEDLENYDIKKIIEQELREKDGIDIDKKKNELNLLLKNHKPVEQYIDEHAQSLGIKKNKVYYRNKTKDIHSWK
ncbi:MAG: ankyrin repeat domain-containing protein, partial [bacterium]|nr:ankyrin repeat domain-containing protein [bacterium]